MNSNTARIFHFSNKQSQAFPAVQMSILFIILALGSALISVTIERAPLNTILLFVFVAIAGLMLCKKTQTQLNDPALKILGYFWLIKLIATLFLLYVGWMPQLQQVSLNSWGFDPQRFYIQAQELIDNNWSPSFISLNYVGILYYYGVIYYAFGHNPVNPALINAFATLLGTLFLIRCAYSFTPERTAKDWTIAGLLLIPEVLWYDVMTSRETIMAVLIIFATLTVGRYMVSVGKTSLINTLILSSVALFAILAVRTSMAIPVFVSIAVMAVLLRSHRKLGPVVKGLLIVLGIGALYAAPLVQQHIGGYKIDYLSTLKSIQSFDSNAAAQMKWSNQSIGLLLAPNNAWESLIYMPPRMILYLVAPLPNVAVSLTELIDGSWGAWQRLMTLPTSVAMLLGFPYVLSGTAQGWRLRSHRAASLILFITFWITFMAVAAGNIIIHERYRLMFTLLLFACMWFGYTRCSRREVIRWARPWFGLLAAGTFFYIGYKFVG